MRRKEKITITIANPIYDVAFKYLMEDEHVVKILPTDLLRFRQYLGTQYLSKENMVGPEKHQHAMPMVAIYLLRHRVGAIAE